MGPPGMSDEATSDRYAVLPTRFAAREVISLESSDSFGYNCNLKSDNWEIPVKHRWCFVPCFTQIWHRQ